MKTLEFKNDIVAIYSNDELGYVFVEWLSPSTSAEYRDAMVKYLDLIEKNNFKATISDVRNAGALSTEDLDWTRTYVNPRRAGLKVEKTAIIAGEDVFVKISLEEIFDKEIKMDNIKQYFQSFEEAEKWIS